MPLHVTLGNTAPANSEYVEVSKKEADDAGLLARRETGDDGKEKYLRLDRKPLKGAKDSETRFSAPDDKSLTDFAREVALSYRTQHSFDDPAWVESNDPLVARLIAAEFGPDVQVRGSSKQSGDKNRTRRPTRLEALTMDGLSDWPRAHRAIRDSGDPSALLVNSGRDHFAAVMHGDLVGETGTATATTATSLTATGTPFVASAYIGHIVVVNAAPMVYGVITANTTSVLTVDKWYTPASPGGAAASTPSATAVYLIPAGGQPAFWMAVTANAGAAGAGDTTLTGEITTGGGGLVRAVATYGHTAGTNTVTLTKTFTANGSDSLPVTLAKIGIFNSGPAAGGRMVFEALLNATVTLTISGDNVAITETVTTS